MVGIGLLWSGKNIRQEGTSQRCNQRQDLCTTEARRHGDTEGKDKWVPSGPVVHLRFLPRQSVDISNLSLRQKDEDTEKQRQGTSNRASVGFRHPCRRLPLLDVASYVSTGSNQPFVRLRRPIRVGAPLCLIPTSPQSSLCSCCLWVSRSCWALC